MKASPKSEKASAINAVFVFFLAGAILFAAFSGQMKEVQEASFSAAKGAVNLSIGLIGIMALWLGLVRVLEAGGLMASLAKLLRPLMVRLFPDVPEDHPAMGAMILNLSANMLGLGNAATPFGIKAMVELNKLNPIPGTATNAMCLFLVINTSSVTILPLGVIGVRAAAGSADPASIFIPTLLATLFSTCVGISLAYLLRKKPETTDDLEAASVENQEAPEPEIQDYSHLLTSKTRFASALPPLLLLTFFAALVYRVWKISSVSGSQTIYNFLSSEVSTYWLMPFLMLLIVCYGISKGVKVYEAVTEGAKQGFDIAVKIIPFLVAILVAIAMFRASGAMDVLSTLVSPLTNLIGMPAEALPMALVRPLSGSGAFGVMSSLIESAPDSYTAYLASVMMGSTETTFYVLAVYFGAVGVTRVRHALPAALGADMAGILAACLLSSLFFY